MSRAPVKQTTPAAGLARHVEGWQAGLVALTVAGIGVAFSLPRPIPPTELPLPTWSPAALAAERRADDARAAAMAASSPEERVARYDQRKLGDCFRRFGHAELSGDLEELGRVREECLQATRVLLAAPDGVEQVRQLRAYQASLFVAALGRWIDHATLSEDLAALGGSLPRDMVESGWITARGATILSDEVREGLFKLRFTEVTGARRAVGLEPDEARRLVAFFLAYPPRDEDPKIVWSFLGQKVEEARKLDPTYPIELARGIVALGLGDADRSAELLGALLAEHPDGPWTGRAKNHLAAALALKDRGEQP